MRTKHGKRFLTLGGPIARWVGIKDFPYGGGAGLTHKEKGPMGGRGLPPSLPTFGNPVGNLYWYLYQYWYKSSAQYRYWYNSSNLYRYR